MMEFVNGKDDIPYMKWGKKKNIFETTNQIILIIKACQFGGNHYTVPLRVTLSKFTRKMPEVQKW